MDLTSASIGMRQAALGMKVGLAIQSKTQDLVIQQGEQLNEMLQQNLHPNLGKILDINA